MMVVAVSLDQNRLTSIDEVRSGAGCGCHCPVCARPLVARKGAQRKHSFAHLSDDHCLSCTNAAETVLHRLAKEMLAERRMLRIPEVVVEDDLGPLAVSQGRTVVFDTVELERREGEVVPDVVATLGDHRLHVEFNVTHPCTPAKLAKISKLDVSLVEVDLSPYRDTRITDLYEVIVAGAPRRMLQSRLFDRAPDMLRERVVRTADILLAAIRDYVPVRQGQTQFAARLRKTFLSPYAIETFGGHRLFEIADDEWQSWVLSALIERKGRPISLAELCGAFRSNGWTGEHERLLVPSVATELRSRGVRILTLKEIVSGFCGYLETIDLALEHGDSGWSAGRELSTYEKNRKVPLVPRLKQVDQIRQQGFFEHRRGRVHQAAATVHANLGFLNPFDHERWLVNASRRYGVTPWAIVMESTLLEDVEAFSRKGSAASEPLAVLWAGSEGGFAAKRAEAQIV